MFVMLGFSPTDLTGKFHPIENDCYAAFVPRNLQRAFVGRATADVWEDSTGARWTYNVHGEVSGTERTEDEAKEAAILHARDAWRNAVFEMLPFYFPKRARAA